MDSESHRRGIERLHAITGAPAEAMVQRLEAISPDMARFVVDFAYGEVLARPGLDLRIRELVSVAVLTSLGGVEEALKMHVQGALHVGATEAEVIEVILQVAALAGFMRSMNGLIAAKQVFDQVRVR